jgi:hypothetical protein
MTSVLNLSGLNYQNGNPLGGEVRRLRNDLNDALKRLEQQELELFVIKNKYNDLLGKLSELFNREHGEDDGERGPGFNPNEFALTDLAQVQEQVSVPSAPAPPPVQPQLTPQQQFLMQRSQIGSQQNQKNTVVAGGARRY